MEGIGGGQLKERRKGGFCFKVRDEKTNGSSGGVVSKRMKKINDKRGESRLFLVSAGTLHLSHRRVYMCVCVCVCVNVQYTAIPTVCVWLCVCVWVSLV